MSDIDTRKWPPRTAENPLFKGKAAVGDVWASVAKTFVSRGYMVCKELGFHGMNRPIPADESRITSLGLGARGRVFGATSGEKVHVFLYGRNPQEDVVLDLGVIADAKEARGTLVAWSADTCFVGTSPAPGRVVKCTAGGVGACIQEWHHGRGKFEEFVTPVPDEGIACLVGDRTLGMLYGITETTGRFFSIEVESKKVTVVGPVDEIQHFSRTLVVARNGNVYGTGTVGKVFCYNPHMTPAIEKTSIQVPSVAGHHMYCRVDSWALDPVSGVIYGGTESDGLLFAFDPSSGSMRSLGKPTSEYRIRALTVGKDGIVYGVCGEPESIGHLFAYDPATASLDDLGTPVAMMEIRRYGYEFEAAIAGPDGEIYLGESDRGGCLFMYFPPMPETRLKAEG